MTKRLIVTADDFGRALPINEAVEDAHRRGILTAASLMVTGDAAADAVERARRLPSLGVGLHITLVDGIPALPPRQIPDLVGDDGRFTDHLVRLGVRIFFDWNTRRQVAAELRAQFELYRATGLPFGHVDAHHHYHLHPTVFDMILHLAREYGAPAIRVPWEPPASSFGVVQSLFHRRRVRRMRRKLKAAGLIANDRVFGIEGSGDMDHTRLAAILARLPDGLSEIYGHPATGGWDDRPMPPQYRTVDEYRALIDPTVFDALHRSGAQLTTFAAEAAAQEELG
ncbi:hopanoid biosynthesis-associated protein HpnK [Telmatospirillum sp.]|uniref:hopanoid biosynthesis-associated protein HpnK n=1 Tax=Telmatospirillum sp. TaxID=2079197 RepID=UPI0028458DEE|nr:hopanoid biosynthesis-associated protein HpnK [Telmatospirillum sp.]MDR3441238.1 hopanoid biosynthesis-associated protein HpnK [Telmatospirillum sp.]